MIRKIATLTSVALVAVTLSSPLALAASDTTEKNMAQIHLGHVMVSWGDTPDEMGFIPTAEAEAAIAILHADLAHADTTDLAAMQLHAGHVLNAVAPSMQMDGPGLGYGVEAAAMGAAKHIGIAAGEPDASDGVVGHAVHVSTSAENVVGWVKDIAGLVAAIQSAGSAAEAAPLVEQMVAAANALVSGIDANGDGAVSWQKGEGGLAVARKHMEIMMQGEGMSL
jgi:hypothetical protein